MTMRLPVLVLAVASLALPVAGAHAAERPLEVETHVLDDEGEDAFYWFDGYDLYNLFVREAYWEPLDDEGLIFRFTLYGGFAPQHVAQALHVNVAFDSPSGPQTLRLSTTDDAAWAGDMEVVVLDVRPDSFPFTGVTAKIQAFVPYARIGAAPGDVISALTMSSYADEELLDVAPGPWYAPGSGGRAEMPSWGSERHVEEVALRGPRGYLQVEHEASGELVKITVHNPFKHEGQHVHLAFTPTAGWTVTPVTPAVLEFGPDGTGTFEVVAHATRDAVAPLRLDLVSDVGGRETYWLGVDWQGVHMVEDLALAPMALPEPERDEAAAPVLPVVLLAILTAAVTRRRP